MSTKQQPSGSTAPIWPMMMLLQVAVAALAATWTVDQDTAGVVLACIGVAQLLYCWLLPTRHNRRRRRRAHRSCRGWTLQWFRRVHVETTFSRPPRRPAKLNPFLETPRSSTRWGRVAVLFLCFALVVPTCLAVPDIPPGTVGVDMTAGGAVANSVPTTTPVDCCQH